MIRSPKLLAYSLLLILPLGALGCGGRDQANVPDAELPQAGTWLEPAEATRVNPRFPTDQVASRVGKLVIGGDQTWTFTIANPDGSASNVQGEATGTFELADGNYKFVVGQSSIPGPDAGKVPATLSRVTERARPDGSQIPTMHVVTQGGQTVVFELQR